MSLLVFLLSPLFKMFMLVLLLSLLLMLVVALCRLRRLRSSHRWSQVLCKTADMLGFVYFSMVLLLLIMFRQKIRGFAEHFKHVLPAMRGELWTRRFSQN